MARQVGQRDVALVGHQTISQACTVDIKRYVVLLAYRVDVVQFAGGIQGSQFGGEGDVHQSGVDGMVAVAVAVEGIQILA